MPATSDKSLRLIHPFKLHTEEKYTNLFKGKWEREAQAYKEFIELYGQKIRIIEHFEYFWEHGSFEEIEQKFSGIKKINLAILRAIKHLVVGITEEGQIVESFLFKLLQEKLKKSGRGAVEENKDKEGHSSLKYYAAKINEYLGAIGAIIKLQNKYIVKNGEWRTIIELRKHGEFFGLLYTESNKIKEMKSLFEIVLNQPADIDKNEIAPKNLHGLHFVKISHYTDDMWKFYYGCYVERFPEPNERETYDQLNERMKQGVYHIIIAKIDDEVIGGLISCFYQFEGKAYGTIFWTCVSDKVKEQGGEKHYTQIGVQLIEAGISDLRAIAGINSSKLLGVFVELNDPKKMQNEPNSEELFTLESMEPLKSIRLWQKLGFSFLFGGYVQLTSNPERFVDYCSLFFLPLSEDWRAGLSKEDLYVSLLGIQKISNGYTEIKSQRQKKQQGLVRDLYFEGSLKGYPPWEKMMGELMKNAFYSLLAYGVEDSDKILGHFKPWDGKPVNLKGSDPSSLDELKRIVRAFPSLRLSNEEIRERYKDCFVTPQDCTYYLAQKPLEIIRAMPFLDSVKKNSNVQIGFIKGKGRCVIAARAFSKGEVITGVDYCGTLDQALIRRVRRGEISGPLAPRLKKLMDDLIQVDDNEYIIPLPHFSFLINHSCNPNAAFVKARKIGKTVYEFRVLKTINKGSEMGFDYSTVVGDDYILECRCGEPECRGFAGRPLIMTDAEKAKLLGRYPRGWLMGYIKKQLKEKFSVGKIKPEVVASAFDGADIHSFLLKNKKNLNPEYWKHMVGYFSSKK